ncbi:MAG: Ig-like domain-containing protein, partial [Limnohabitans sp.]|nr:Ig-like domain-containing protein [Limnohabitans sp.]
MTKDSGLQSGNADWTTNDTSAGRLVSGFLSAPLAAGEVVNVYRDGVKLGTATVATGGATWVFTDTTAYAGGNNTAPTPVAGWTYKAAAEDAQGNEGQAVTTDVSVDNTVVTSDVSGTGGADSTLAYSTGTLSSLAGNDVITASGTNLQTELSSGGMIDAGSGIDTLKLAAGTTLNLETLTSNQTVKSLEQVEIITMSGSSSVLTMSANTVLSLGGANSTMTGFSFSSTTLTPLNGVTPTSTSSAGKVQFVVEGQTGDTLNLDALANDGVVSTNGASSGLLGNTHLTGTWAYKGEVTVTGVDGQNHTYKVYDHSTTKAQVLVDVPVTVNTLTPITITAISTDTGASGIDFTTSDQTLTYTGQLPASYDSASQRVLVQLTDKATGATSDVGFAAVNGTTWTLDNETVTQAEGKYTITATIVGLNDLTPVAAYGSQGVAKENMTIDTTTPTVIVTRSGSATLDATGTETITFTLSEDSTDFTSADVAVTGGTISNFSGSGKTYTATFAPDSAFTGTATVGVESSKFSDAAGNLNQDTFASGVSGAVTETNNKVDIAVDATPPTQTVTLSSMTKDSGLQSGNADWTTNDASAGRLVSGTLSAPLAAGEVVNVYRDGVLLGTATVAAGGNTWAFTDNTVYAGGNNTAPTPVAGWTYTAAAADAQGNQGTLATTQVYLDNLSPPPVITGVTDSGNAAVGATGTNGSNLNPTTKTLSTVSGTGESGHTIYLYDNSIGNLVGSATVDSNGQWTVTQLKGTFTGSNSFSAKQVDPLGNESVLSNLWTVSAQGTNMLTNGDFTDELNGWTPNPNVLLKSNVTAQNFYGTTGLNVGVLDASLWGSPIANRGDGTGTKLTSGVNSNSGVISIENDSDRQTYGNPDGLFAGKVLAFNLNGGSPGETKFISQTINVEAGKTYSFSFVWYGWMEADLKMYIGDSFLNFAPWDAADPWKDIGNLKGTFVATSTGPIDIAFSASNQVDYAMDNFHFAESATAFNNSLVPGSTPPATSGPDAALTYNQGGLSALAGNDVVTVQDDIQAKLAAGGFINGGSGVDTLKLAAGTSLNLTALAANQTVKSIEQMEVFEMQGASTLTLSANEVLSLGGSNASTMAAYSFTSTTGGAASANSTGKVQFVVKGTSTDVVVLDVLNLDGVTTNGAVGNTGLAGQWDYMGTASVGGVTYKVYNHSTTQAQVLTQMDATIKSNAIAFSSMTKDSGPSGTNADWFTADTSAGRLVSGTVSKPLVSGDVVNVYANGALIGTATVNAAGTAWAITDPNGYNANWVYSANIVSCGVTSATAAQPVRIELPEPAPTITGVTDSANAAVGATGTNGANVNPTSKTLSSVSGTGDDGNTIYLYDNSTSNLVGTATVSNGTWTVNNLSGTFSGSNTFAAKQVDATGNES